MKHFAEARRDSLKVALEDPGLRSRIKRGCLIWDVRGRLRVLLQANPGEDLATLRKQAAQLFQRAAEGFWGDQVWIGSEETPKPEQVVHETAWKESTLKDEGPPEIRILDRHLTKGTWFSPPLAEPWPLNDKTPPVISFFSFKGGVGRSTALASLAVQLSRSGKSVAVIDLDLEAPGLSSIFPGAEGRTAPYGVVDYLLERSILSDKEIDLEDYYHLVDDPAVIGSGPPITVVPAGVLDQDYLEKLARLDYEVLYRLPQQESSVQPLHELLKHIRGKRKPEYILLDSRAGLHDLGGLALSGVSHMDVLFGLETDQSWRGLEAVVRFLGIDRIERGQKQLHCCLVLAMAPDPGAQRDESRQNFLERSYDLFSRQYYEEPGPDAEWPLPAIDDALQPHFPAVLGFEQSLQRYRSVQDVADRLASGDFVGFGTFVLDRVGRTL